MGIKALFLGRLLMGEGGELFVGKGLEFVLWDL